MVKPRVKGPAVEPLYVDDDDDDDCNALNNRNQALTASKHSSLSKYTQLE